MREGHWQAQADQWQWIGAPLRPSPADLAVFSAAVHTPAPRALLLGVTPEIATMAWPPGTALLAVDHSPAMIRRVWPGRRAGAAVVCASWTALPTADASFDLVIGDGCFTPLPYPEVQRQVLAAVHRVLRAGARFVGRFFVRPEHPEPLAAVVDDLRRGAIGNFHVFKWRLAMALHGDLDQGVRLADVWTAWRAAVPDPAALAAARGWPPPVVATIDAYREVTTRYTFPTLTELRAQLTAAAFTELACHVPAYELGDRCPTLICAPVRPGPPTAPG
ncbi:MAG TPA: class I SAM-dependent methyltransferase [Kofleriaceae bacterium]|nr:class I SAM-dependent methyltransferase [Kofleriaceae bacterium]